MLRHTRIIFLFLKQFSTQLVEEAEVFSRCSSSLLAVRLKVVSLELSWMRVLVFLTALAKATLPSRVVTVLDETPQGPSVSCSPVWLKGVTLGLAGSGGGRGGGGGGGGGTARVAGGGSAVQVPGLSPCNLVCLHALVTAALILSGMLGPSWFTVLEAHQNI